MGRVWPRHEQRGRPLNAIVRRLVVEMARVVSSAMTAVGYDPSSRRMKITFTQGHTYDFCGVPQHIYQGLMRAISKGTYYNDHIKDRYPC